MDNSGLMDLKCSSSPRSSSCAAAAAAPLQINNGSYGHGSKSESCSFPVPRTFSCIASLPTQNQGWLACVQDGLVDG